MTNYLVKSAADLTAAEINTILESWDVDEWTALNADQFTERFAHSEFHLLTDADNNLLSVARLNFKFKVKVEDARYDIAELVGFVAVVVLEGYGKILLEQVAGNLQERKVQAMAFCRRKNSPYYEGCGFRVFADKVKHLRELQDDKWFTPKEDDDIVSLTLSAEMIRHLENLSEDHPAYLLFEL